MLQIGMAIDVLGGLDRSMTQPSLYDVRIDIRFAEVDGGRMAHVVSGQTLLGQGETPLGCKAEIFLDDRPYAESRKRTCPLIDEEMIDGRRRPPSMVTPVEFEEPDDRRPQGRKPFLSAFADDSDGPIGKIEPIDPCISGLLSPGAGVIEENKNTEVPYPVGRRSRRLFKESPEFLRAERLHQPLRHTFTRDRQDASGMDLETRMMEGEILEERLDSGQALISSPWRIVPAIFPVFQMLKKAEDGFGIEVFDAEPGPTGTLHAGVADQELEGVTVAADRVDAQSLLPSQIGLKKVQKMALEVACH
jgi:hypothetical protein